MTDWDELQQRARERYEDGEARLPDDPDARATALGIVRQVVGATGTVTGDAAQRLERVAAMFGPKLAVVRKKQQAGDAA